MIAAPVPNLMSRPYRGLSVQDVTFELTEAALIRWIVGRDVYRRTEFILARNGNSGALIAIGRREGGDLFVPVSEARVVALPGQLEMVDSPATDVGNASAMAEAAARHHRPGAMAYAITGRYKHVNFIWQPQPVTVFVDEVVPPHPAKLVDMARQAIAYDEDLPPIALVQRLTSISQMARSIRGGKYLLPCQGAADEVPSGEPVQFLDTGPAYHPDWTLIGCHRSEQIFEHFYGQRPDSISFCPEQSGAGAPPGARRLTKCCLIERGIRAHGNVAVVPWGARLDEVRSALALIVNHKENGVA
jgi:hypothetical protein